MMAEKISPHERLRLKDTPRKSDLARTKSPVAKLIARLR